MSLKKSLMYVGLVAILVISGLLALRSRSSDDTPANKRPSLYEPAGLGPSTTSSSTRKLTPTPTPTPAPPAMTTSVSGAASVRTENPDRIDPLPPGGRAMGGNGEDMHDSPERMAMIGKVEAYADDIFNAPAADEEGWTVNQQDMDQQDYATQDGAEVTKWFNTDAGGSGVVQAEEAQMPNGEIVDRWYGDNGKVNQVMHQYDERNSFSIYYYDNGQPEATRVIKDGNEIFTKYDRDGRQLEKTYTPQVRD